MLKRDVLEKNDNTQMRHRETVILESKKRETKGFLVAR